MNRRPTHPGEMLREDFLSDYGLTTASLAEAIGVCDQCGNRYYDAEILHTVHAIATGKRQPEKLLSIPIAHLNAAGAVPVT